MKRLRKVILVIAFAFLTCLTNSPCVIAGEANEKVKLHIKFEQGRKHAIQTDGKIAGQMQLTIDGVEKKTIESDILIDARSTLIGTVKMVSEEGDGLVELRAKEMDLNGILFGQKTSLHVEEGRMVVTIGELKIDTQALPEAERKRIHALLFGPLMITMRPDGKVSSAIGFERFQFFIPNFDPQQFFEQLPPIFPDEEVAIGEAWQRDFKLPTPFAEQPIPVKMNIKLESVRIDEATKAKVALLTIEAKSEISNVESITQLPQLRKPIKMKVENATLIIDGEAFFDITNEVPLRVELKFSLDVGQSAEVPKELLRQEGLIEEKEKVKDETAHVSVEIKISGSMLTSWEKVE
ncbi:MAG: hypothetical protein RUDDFDWM_000424 [Candidatus Fervidibacterota bacterium]